MVDSDQSNPKVKLHYPHFLNPLAKFAVLVYNHLRSRRILACPTVAQSETYKA